MRREDKCKMLVPHGVAKQLMEEGFGSQPTIRKALRGTYNEKNFWECHRALRIRGRARHLGGVLAMPEE